MNVLYGRFKPLDCTKELLISHGDVLSLHGLFSNITQSKVIKAFGKVNQLHVALKQHPNLAVLAPQSIHISVL